MRRSTNKRKQGWSWTGTPGTAHSSRTTPKHHHEPLQFTTFIWATGKGVCRRCTIINSMLRSMRWSLNEIGILSLFKKKRQLSRVDLRCVLHPWNPTWTGMRIRLGQALKRYTQLLDVKSVRDVNTQLYVEYVSEPWQNQHLNLGWLLRRLRKTGWLVV